MGAIILRLSLEIPWIVPLMVCKYIDWDIEILMWFVNLLSPCLSEHSTLVESENQGCRLSSIVTIRTMVFGLKMLELEAKDKVNYGMTKWSIEYVYMYMYVYICIYMS